MSKALLNTAACRFAASLLAAALTFSISPAMAEGDAAAGKTKAATCIGCHGADGNSLLPNTPSLASQHPSYIAKQLHDFKSGERVNAVMAGMSAALSDQDIEDISAFFASLPPVAGVANEEDLELGRNIFRGGVTAAGIPSCSGCHGAAGKGNPAAAWPALAGQRADYTKLQLETFRSKERANDPNAMMRSIAERLTDKEINAVANYIQGLY